MKSRPKNRALLYERRSDDGQQASLEQQCDWAKSTAASLGVPFRGTYADIETMQKKKLHNLHDIYLDDAVTGGDLTRPGSASFSVMLSPTRRYRMSMSSSVIGLLGHKSSSK